MPNFSLPGQVFLAAAQQYQTPFHLYDEAAIRRTARPPESRFFRHAGVSGVFRRQGAAHPRHSAHFEG